MKRFKLVAVLLTLVAIASIAYAAQKSSTASQTAQNPSTATAQGGGWTCPMWGWGQAPGNQAKGSTAPYGPMGPGMMYGQSISGEYVPMGPGMMYYYYGPANPPQNQSGNGNSGPSAQQPQSAP